MSALMEKKDWMQTVANVSSAESVWPFDRMLLAHAKSERIKIVSHDRQFPQYGDFVIPV